MRSATLPLCIAGMIAAILAAPAFSSTAIITIPPAQIVALHITAAPLAVQTGSNTARIGVATVLDSAGYLLLVADKRAADALAAASQADANRQAALYAGQQDVSLRAVEMARAQAVGDRARASYAASRLGLEWSPALSTPSPALIAALNAGRTRIIRIETTDASTRLHIGQTVSLGRSSGAALTARIVGAATGVSSVADGPAWLAIATASMLHTREPLDVSVTTTAQSRLLVPSGAVVMLDGKAWLFRAMGMGRFQRLALPIGATASNGGFLLPASSLAAGTQLVVRGAGALLSIEAGNTAEVH